MHDTPDASDLSKSPGLSGDVNPPTVEQLPTSNVPPPPIQPHPLPSQSDPQSVVPQGTAIPRWVVLTAVIAVVAGLIGGALAYFVADRLSDGDVVLPVSRGKNVLADRAPESVAGIVKRVDSGVVTIAIAGQGGSGNGSGFVIADAGYILTNNHVAAAGGKLDVVFNDGSVSSAAVIGNDPGSDVAVLKVDRGNLTVLPLGDSENVLVGDPVVAFGAPLGLSGTVTAGIVSAIDRPVVTGDTADDTAYMAAIQTDAAINPGNSGGPLVNGAGEVIGINSAIATAPGSEGSIGLGFAIPINHARRVAEQLINKGRATTTVIGATIDREYDTPGAGVRLAEVDGNSPAAGGGLRAGDIVIRFDGHVVEDPVALIALIRQEKPGNAVAVEYERNGDKHETKVTLGER